ncbi:MAG: VWA domain-containing protein, partial [Desulfobacteraceae bacterium]|nr:VWA domain-containing protein [Desulfobacteraceae bacterium]
RGLDRNLMAAEKDDPEGYSFSADPNEGIFYVCHAKGTFPEGSLPSLSPSSLLRFREVFFIVDIDWDAYRIELVRQQDQQRFHIGITDFEKGFLWYNALLDDQKAYIPVYGFLSLPGEAEAFPTIWDSWLPSRKDTATPPESLVDYDFYKVLDYRDGMVLLGQDFNELDYRGSVDEYGIIGWVEKKYITLWRSRLYYHPLQEATFYDDRALSRIAPETEEINRFYVRHAYLKERLFQDIVEKLDQESLHRFYSHFGFPRMSEAPMEQEPDVTKVFVPGAFTPRLMRMLAKSLKSNINVFFLLDTSESMRPFADYVRSFNRAVRDMEQEGIALRLNRTFAFSDSAESDRNLNAPAQFRRVRENEEIRFVQTSEDRNYAEPLMRALTQVIYEIERLQSSGAVLPLQPKLLFVLTDAGPNDLTEEALAYTLDKARELHLSLYFIHPEEAGVKVGKTYMEDSPDKAYQGLLDLVALVAADSGGTSVHQFSFQHIDLQNPEQRQRHFMAQQKKLLQGIQAFIDQVVGQGSVGKLPKDVVLYFSDAQLLAEMRRWSDRKIQILNHVVKYIDGVRDKSRWEERIAIPAKPVETYLRAARTQDDISLADLKKLVIINSLVSVDDIESCRRLYDQIKPLIERKIFRSADAVFYQALTNREPGAGIRWNQALGDSDGDLPGFLADRSFHLNSFNQAVQRKFMFLKVDELYASQP